MTDLQITYHNASGKRCQMIIDMDQFFPCYKSWMEKLLRLVIRRSDAPEVYEKRIRGYLQVRLDLIGKWLEDHECIVYEQDTGKYLTRRIDCSVEDYNKIKSNEKKIRACLDLIGGADEQHSNSSAG